MVHVNTSYKLYHAAIQVLLLQPNFCCPQVAKEYILAGFEICLVYNVLVSFKACFFTNPSLMEPEICGTTVGITGRYLCDLFFENKYSL